MPREDVLFAHATDSLHVDEHCPDCAVVMLHHLKQVLVVICGTRMIPAPKMKDVFMDLYADAAPFLHGEAHMGMALGAKNVLNKTLDKISEQLNSDRCQGYNIMVIGYSLGAGICQLVAMDLVENEERKRKLPDGTRVRCVSFGAPPVFSSKQEKYSCPNVFSIVYNNDGLASASTASVTKLFMQIRAVNRLGLRRRDMLKLLINPIPTVEGPEIDDEDEDADDDFNAKSGSRRTPDISASAEWTAIRDAVINSDADCRLRGLEHPAGNVFIFKRNETAVITRRLKDASPLSENLRLRAAMFNHHMPWGYNALFLGYGEDGISPDDVEILQIDDEQTTEITTSSEHQPQQQQLYPDLSGL